MKTFNEALQKTKSQIFGSEDRIVHCIHTHKGYKTLETPKMASEMECIFCGHKEGYTCKIDKDTRSWICGRVCPSSKLPKFVSSTYIPPKPRRSLEWALFCENNGLGDLYHDVKFDLIDQNQGKLDFLKKFAKNCQGLLLMHGSAGTGKTYACLGLCELFTRTSEYAKFTTMRQLIDDWSRSFDPSSNFVRDIKRVELLIIDDVGTGTPPDKFMEFFMDLINSRMQWKNRGTVITTNLTPEKLSEICGDALSDRFKTAQQFVFSGKSRRAPPQL